MSAVQIVTLVVVGVLVLSCLAFFLSDLWKMRKVLDRVQPEARSVGRDNRSRVERKPRSSKDQKGNRLKVIK